MSLGDTLLLLLLLLVKSSFSCRLRRYSFGDYIKWAVNFTLISSWSLIKIRRSVRDLLCPEHHISEEKSQSMQSIFNVQ